MRVPTAVFQAAGFDTSAAVRLKEQFDAQDLLLRHMAAGLVTQEILRDEFGIAQLGKRLQVLDAARSYQVANQQETTTTTVNQSTAVAVNQSTAVAVVPATDLSHPGKRPQCTDLSHPGKRPQCTTVFGKLMCTQLRDTYSSQSDFTAAVNSVVLSARKAGERALQLHRCRKSSRSGAAGRRCIALRCKGHNCKVVVRAHTSNGHWVLSEAAVHTSGATKQHWDHAPDCRIQNWPTLEQLSNCEEVRGLILAKQSPLAMKPAITSGSFVRELSNLGITFPAQASHTTERKRKHAENQLIYRLVKRVLGYDKKGVERDLTALVQWVRAYNDASPGAVDYAHLQLDADRCFQSVTVVYAYTLELVTRKGLRVFAMDACHYVGVADDALRMLVLEGYFANNTLCVLALSVCLGETAQNYATMLAAVREHSTFWSYFDNPSSTLFIDRGSAITAAVKNPLVLQFGDAMYRHCWIHVARNCEANKGWGKCPKSLLFQLAGATTQEETVILRELRKVHSHVHEYVMSTNRSRWIARYNVGKLDHLLICSNAVEIHNSAAKRVSDLLAIHSCLWHVFEHLTLRLRQCGARQVMPLQSIDLITRLAHRQVNTFINESALIIKQGLPATHFCSEQYQTLKMIANEYTVLHPRLYDPWGVHTVVHCRLTSAVGHGTFQTCVKPDCPSCTCSFHTWTRKGLPCPHMIGVYRKSITGTLTRTIDSYE
eukprot:COSAG01_NODE_3656_length_5822_cov_4.253364_1_plen_714_part_10